MEKNNIFPNKDFWKGKNVFVTGHTGFKGGWLCIWLSKLGANVTGYSLNPNSDPSFFEACKVDLITKSIIGDILDYNFLEASIKKNNPDIIIHMAAQSLVLESYKNPLNTYKTNVIGTLNILEIVKNFKKIKAFINVTTDKCYRNEEKQYSYKEDDPLGGYDPYSSSKACSELVTSAYRQSFFNEDENIQTTSIATARSGNVVGGGDWSQYRLIPDFFRSASQKKTIKIRHPSATRPWQHVLEPLRGYLILSEQIFQNKGYDEAWNFGPNNNDVSTVKEVLTELNSQWNKKVDIKFNDIQNYPHEAKLLSLDISKASSRLNWQPVLNIKKTISMTCDWYKKFYAGKSDMYLFSLDQIKEYEFYK